MYEFVMEQLQASKGRWPVVAEESGVALTTVRKIAKREVENPGVLTIETLARYFRGRAAGSSGAALQ